MITAGELTQPNNLRNRYRRYRATVTAYGLVPVRFRGWARGWGLGTMSYAAPAHWSRDPVTIGRAA